MVSCSKLAPDLASELRTGRRSVAPATSSSIVSTESAMPMIHRIAPIRTAPSSPEDAHWLSANGIVSTGDEPLATDPIADAASSAGSFWGVWCMACAEAIPQAVTRNAQLWET